MRPSAILSAVLAAGTTALAGGAGADQRVASIYIQPVASSSSATEPTFLAELAIPDQDPSTASPSASSSTAAAAIPAQVLAYEAPDLDLKPDSATNPQQQSDQRLFRIGVYDPAARRWLSSTSVLSAANFDKGYAPHFVLSVDGGAGAGGGGEGYLGVVCRGVRIDAGQTRDFGPQAVVVRTAPGAQPVLGKPVVLSPEGRKVEVEEKSFLQKYWWALAIGAFLLLSGGGGQD